MTTTKSVFSWHREPILQPQATFNFLKTHQMNQLYQMISPKESPEQILNFLKIAKIYPVDLYFLIGEAEWALDPDAKEAIRMLEWLATYQDYAKGIVLDIEPHTLREFKTQPKKTMVSFVKAVDTIYNKLTTVQLEVVVCLPYYFDTMGFTAELEKIIKHSSDSIAVMNYYREKEMEHIKTEAQFVQKHRKKLVNIYELQPPNTHGLTDRNTYYNYGLEAVYRNFEQLKRAYPFLDLHLSFHELHYFMELAKKE